MNREEPSFQTQDYRFDLPEDRIADRPLECRDDSRLLVFDRQSRSITHTRFRELPDLFPEPVSLVVNNTKVIRARLLGERIGTGGKVEFFLLKKETSPVGEGSVWSGLMKTGSKVNSGYEFQCGGIRARVLSRRDTPAGAIFTAWFEKDPVQSQVGEVPLPPYIQSKWEGAGIDFSSETVLKEYNTLFATEEGSVAAPTAGRHFTPELISMLKKRGWGWNEITLHVGLGTFKPVTVSDVRDHLMHPETATILPDVSERLNLDKSSGRRILAVGTTTTRTLEAFTDSKGRLKSGTAEVDLFIYPGSSHRWKFVDSMITNFHLPESTLLMMIASFIGSREETLKVYREAIAQGYRFYSYGDAMLIL